MLRSIRCQVFFMYARHAHEGIEPDDTARVIVRLVNCRKMHPTHQSTASEHAALHNAAVCRQTELEYLVPGEETRDVLPPHVAWKGLQSLSQWRSRPNKCTAQIIHYATFWFGVFVKVMAEHFQGFTHGCKLSSQFPDLQF